MSVDRWRESSFDDWLQEASREASREAEEGQETLFDAGGGRTDVAGMAKAPEMMCVWEQAWTHEVGDVASRREFVFVVTTMGAVRARELDWRDCVVRMGAALWMWRKLRGDGRDGEEGARAKGSTILYRGLAWRRVAWQGRGPR